MIPTREAELNDRLLQRERDLDAMRCQLMDTNRKIVELEHGIKVIQFNSANNAAGADLELHKVEADRDDLTERVNKLIETLTAIVIPEAR